MRVPIVSLSLLLVAACNSGTTSPRTNPFLDDNAEDDKADTAYFNPDGIEVEVDLEGDVHATASRIGDAPADLAQFAMTYFRSKGLMYLESLAEDRSQTGRVEWQIEGTWRTAAQVESDDVPAQSLTHFRLRGLSAVLLNDAKAGVKEGSVFTAPVPTKMTGLFEALGDSCAEDNPAIELDSTVYWYLWNPEKSSCKVETTDLTVTVSKMFPSVPTVYPEYDKLVADKKVTVVALFGQIGHGDTIDDNDPGITGAATMKADLEQAGFAEVSAPVGVRMQKVANNGITLEVDLYDAHVFAGLEDSAHYENFEKAVNEHEIVVYDGHSMLGASDFWSRPSYNSGYQIFLYGGCLGYEYYIRPIVEQKNGWKNLDMLTSVVEVSADANQFAGPALNKIFKSVSTKTKSSWRTILNTVRTSVGDSTFGVSGVRDNCFSPQGSRCN